MAIPLVSERLAKSHIAAYTKKDGTFVAAHDDKRSKAAASTKKPKKGGSYKLFSSNDKNTSHDPWTDEQWSKLRLDESNSNASTHHKIIGKMRSMAAAGDVDGLKNMTHGVNTYGKKRALIAKHLIGAMTIAKPAAEVVKTDDSKTIEQPKAKPENLDRARKLAGSEFDDMSDDEVSKTMAYSEKGMGREFKPSEASYFKDALRLRRKHLEKQAGAEQPKFHENMYGTPKVIGSKDHPSGYMGD